MGSDTESTNDTDRMTAWLVPFRRTFTAPTSHRVLVLASGAIISSGRRTVCSALRAVGLSDARDFSSFHRVLNCGRWNARSLRWQVFMLLPWTARVWGLPFLTLLCPSERYTRERGRLHRKLTDRARRSLRPDVRLFNPLPARYAGTPTANRKPSPTLAARLESPDTRWNAATIAEWYGGQDQRVEFISGTALWHNPGRTVPIRYVLVRDLTGHFRPQAFLCTNLDALPRNIIRWFVRRSSMEVTFAETRRHLGIETQRQWSDPAIARTTSVLMGLFSVVTLAANDLYQAKTFRPRHALRLAWAQTA